MSTTTNLAAVTMAVVCLLLSAPAGADPYARLELTVNAVGADSDQFIEGGAGTEYVAGSAYAEGTRLDGNGYGWGDTDGWADCLNADAGVSYDGYAIGYNDYQAIRSGSYNMKAQVWPSVTVGPGGGFGPGDPVQFVLYAHAEGEFHGDGGPWTPGPTFELSLADHLGIPLHSVCEQHDEVSYGSTVSVSDDWSGIISTTVGSTEQFRLMLWVYMADGFAYGGQDYPASGNQWAEFGQTGWLKVGPAPGYEGLDLTGIPLITEPVVGDTQPDGCVDGLDYNCWSLHYLQTGQPAWSAGGWSVGNFNEDAIVDGLDYNGWSLHYLEGCAAGAQVPEPAGLSLLALGAAALIRRRQAGRNRKS